MNVCSGSIFIDLNLMDHSETIGELAKITDEGLFERLATAVLRQAHPALYSRLSHPGINPAGKTRRSPVDAIAFVTSENPPRMVIAHHTTAGPTQAKPWTSRKHSTQTKILQVKKRSRHWQK